MPPCRTKCVIFLPSVDPNDQKKTACYDIDVEVDDTLKTQMNSFLLSTASQQEIAGLDNKVWTQAPLLPSIILLPCIRSGNCSCTHANEKVNFVINEVEMGPKKWPKGRFKHNSSSASLPLSRQAIPHTSTLLNCWL